MLLAILCGIPWPAAAQTQKVTINVKDADVQVVFRQIKEQTGLNFVYNADQLREMPKVSLNVKDASSSEKDAVMVGSSCG